MSKIQFHELQQEKIKKTMQIYIQLFFYRLPEMKFRQYKIALGIDIISWWKKTHISLLFSRAGETRSFPTEADVNNSVLLWAWTILWFGHQALLIHSSGNSWKKIMVVVFYTFRQIVAAASSLLPTCFNFKSSFLSLIIVLDSPCRAGFKVPSQSCVKHFEPL